MSLCERCSKGGYHGIQPGKVCTVYFWCPVRKSHDNRVTMCADFERGVPGKFGKRWERIDG